MSVSFVTRCCLVDYSPPLFSVVDSIHTWSFPGGCTQHTRIHTRFSYLVKPLLRVILMCFIRFPSRWALERAKKNVEKYAVVGVLEEYDDFIKVLEKLLPSFFKGAYKISKIPGNMNVFTMHSILGMLSALFSAPRFIYESEINVIVD